MSGFRPSITSTLKPPAPFVMSYLDRVQACNRLDLSDQLPFLVDGHGFGWVARTRAMVLAHHPQVFSVYAQKVAFADHLTTAEARSAALADIVPALLASGLFNKPRGEIYAAKRVWSEPAAFLIDRSLVPAFGLRAFGVHVNGIVQRANGLHLWIGTRAMDREVEPGKLDNIVAGGQPAHLSLMDNLIKECAEEADLSPALAQTARPVGAISYAFTTPGGVKADTLFCFDLDVPAEVTPRNTDGEIADFALMPVGEVLRLIREADRFKFNVNLVILDFAIRRGFLTPDQEPDYERILAGLQQRPESAVTRFSISQSMS